MSGTVWMWSFDSKHPRGLLEFISDGTIKYRYKNREGSWSLRDDEATLVAAFGGETHELKYYSAHTAPLTAVLMNPTRIPHRSIMWWQKGSSS